MSRQVHNENSQINQSMRASKPEIIFTALVALPIGVLLGFFLGVLSSDSAKEFVEAVFWEPDTVATEKLADVDRPKSIARPHFELKYPGNWTLDQEADDFDIDQFFGIDTPGGSFVLFEVFPVYTDPKENLKDSLDYYRKLLREPKETPLEKWGQFEGLGVKLSGKYLSDPSEIRIFSHSDDEKSFTVTEFYDLPSEHLVKPGYDLIERTFALRPGESKATDADSISVED